MYNDNKYLCYIKVFFNYTKRCIMRNKYSCIITIFISHYTSSRVMTIFISHYTRDCIITSNVVIIHESVFFIMQSLA